jgi:C1A family cysteine protease
LRQKYLILMKYRFTLIIVGIISFSPFGFTQRNYRQAPLDSSFLQYRQEVKAGNRSNVTIDHHGLGYIPSSLTKIFNQNTIKRLKSSVILPASYDLRSNSWVTSVKDQGSLGTCWAFATMASIESSWKKLYNVIADLSEENMVTCHGFEWTVSSGGNDQFATAYLSRLSGPISEMYDPYIENPNATCSANTYPISAFVPESRWLPNDRDLLKKNIMDYGAIATDICMGSDYFSYYNSVDYTYYYSGVNTVDHGVTIVGWDDNKVVTGGYVSPKGTKGAWIVKNSWGTDFGDKGYFYVSYFDKRFLSSATYYPLRLGSNSIAQIYMYDKLGACTAYGFNQSYAYALTRFVAPYSQFFSKVGTYIISAGSIIDIEVYTHKEGDNLSGLVASLPNQICDWPGYYTFDLPFRVSGEFYIKIKYSTPNTLYPVPVEASVDDDFGDPYARPEIQPQGFNWISSDGIKWDSLGSDVPDHEADLCIRAYACKSTGPIAFFASDRKDVCTGSSVVFRDSSDGSISSWNWDFGKDALPSTASGKGPHRVTFDSTGRKTISLTVTGPSGSNTLTRNFYINVVSALNVIIPYDEVNVTKGKEVSITAFGADSYLWQPSVGLNTVNGATVLASPQTDQVYTVTGTMGVCNGEDKVLVHVRNSPENDDISNALPLNMGLNGPYTNAWATVEDHEPVPPLTDCNTQLSWCDEGGLQNSIWFTFTPSRPGAYSFTTSGMDTQIALYQASDANDILSGNATLIAANDDYFSDKPYPAAIEPVELTEGNKYWLQMDGSAGGDTGKFTIYVNEGPVGIKKIDYSENSLVISPNPSNGNVQLTFHKEMKGNVQITISDIRGVSVVQKKILFTNPINLDLSNLAKGIYLVYLKNDDQSLTGKLVIK